MMRWFVGIVILSLAVLFVVGSPPVRAATAISPPSSDCDEHPWDFLKYAYKVEILVVTSDYVLLAVWYTKEQATPVIIRVDLRSKPDSGSQKTGTQNTFIFLD